MNRLPSRSKDFCIWLCCWCGLLLSPFAWSVACNDVFTNGVQSHAANGSVHLGYMSRVYGGGTVLDTPTLTMTSTWQDQAGLCGTVVCTASGSPAAASSPTLLTGSYVPTSFLTGSGSNGNINVPQGAQQDRAVGDYGTVTVQANNARLRFTSVGATYRMRGVTTEFRSVLELQPGDYWINGNLVLGEQMTLRRLNGSAGPVRLYVNGNVTTQRIFVEGFSPGQLMIYASGNINFGNETQIPGFVYAQGSVNFTQNAVVSGGVYAPSFSTGNSMSLTYSQINENHFLGNFTADHQATVRLQPGDYWFNGNLVLNEVTLQRLNGAPGPVRIFVSGNIDIRHAARFTNFGPGQLLIYSAQRIDINSQQHVPAFIYAAGDVVIGFRSGVTGAVAGRNVSVGQESIITYVSPSDLGALCDDDVAAVAYYQLTHGGPALTCMAEPVTISAFDANGQLMAPAAGTQLMLGTVPATGAWVGGNTWTFSGTESSIVKYLQQTSAATLQLQASDGVALGSSTLEFLDTALKFYGDNPLVNPVPVSPMVAGNNAPALLWAVRTNTDTGACEGRVTGTRPAALAFECRNPDSCMSGQVFTINGTAVQANNANNTIGYAPVSLNFDANGMAALNLNYTDVGQVRLHAQLALPAAGNDPAITLAGSSNEFVVKPHSLAISSVTTAGGAANPGTTDGGSGFVAAGEIFHARIDVLNAQGNRTPNFGNENPPHNVRVDLDGLIYPAGGNSGLLTGADSFAASSVPGQFINQGLAWNEVGSIELQPALVGDDYLGAGAPIDNVSSGTVGRFYPWQFVLQNSAVTPGCGMFTYMGQPFGFGYRIEAQNVQNERTTNYSTAGYAQTAQVDYVAENGGDGINLNVDDNDPAYRRLSVTVGGGGSLVWVDGILDPGGATAAFARALDSQPDGPYETLRLGIKLANELDSRPLAGLDMHLVQPASACANDACDAVALGTAHEFRFGRLRLDDAFGPETAALPVNFVTEYWNSNLFVHTLTDSCTRIPLDKIHYPAGTIDVAANRTVTWPGAATEGIYESLQVDHVQFNGGRGPWSFTAPGAPRPANDPTFPVGIDLEALPWLRSDWNQDGDFNNDQWVWANFGFGQYRGHDRIIYWREVLEN